MEKIFDQGKSLMEWGIWHFDQNLSKKSQIPRGLRGGMGSFVIDWYITSATWRRLTGSLKPGFHMLATIATLALIAAIAEKKKFSYRGS